MEFEVGVWWRPEPLKTIEESLLEKLFAAHHFSANRDNASSVAVANAASASGELTKAIAAGLLTLGGNHAPIRQTYEFLSWEMPWAEARHFLKWGKKIPGWGGNFQKDKPDPIWEPVDCMIKEHYPVLAEKLEKVTAELHACGKLIFPNPSAYTAASAIALGLNAKAASYLFIRARLDAWTIIASNYL